MKKCVNIANSSALLRLTKSTWMAGLLPMLVLLLNLQTSQAGSATWNLNPTSSDWNTAANWTPATVPNGASDIATFGVSNTGNVSLSAETEVSGIVFNPGASGFTISPGTVAPLTISGAGITNNSGVTQNFVTVPDANFNHAWVLFTNNANAGNLTTFTNKAAVGVFTYGGETFFYGNSNAGNATIITEGGAVGAQIIGGAVALGDNASAGNATFITGGGTTDESNGGEVAFQNDATAGNALFINNPATASRAQGGFVEMLGGTGGDAIFINNGSSVVGAGGGVTAFYDGSNAGNCTLIANGGTNGGRGGEIWFYSNSLGGTPRVQVFGNGFLDTSNSNVTIGSIEGDGDVFVGPLALAIGANNLDSTFSGRIRDNSFSGGGGTVKKIGSGTLVLVGASSYLGRTTIEGGTLEVSNLIGSGTGTGPLRVRNGNLGGSGRIGGAVTVGTGSGPGAFLGPGENGVTPGTLTIQNKLKLLADATYNVTMDSDVPAADKVSARGVRISGASILFDDLGSSVLLPGTVFTVISNTATTPIEGTFGNLADGATVTVGNNTFQSDYQGGDGNDLTLTVVP